MLYDALLRLEDEGDNEELIDWVEGVCDPEHGVIDGLVANFIDYIDDKNYSNLLLKILKMLNQHVSKVVMPQLMSNMYFPQAMITYICEIDLKDLTGDALIILVNIFDDASVD